MARGPQALDERTAPEQRRLVPTARAAKLLGLLVVPVAVLATGITVVAASYSSFSSATSAPNNSWSTGSVVLTNDVGTAQFTSPVMKPGDVVSRCIVVTSTGTLPANVRLYTSGITTTNALSGFLDVTITQGSGGSGGSCTGFTAASAVPVVTGTLASLGLKTNFAAGISPWTTAGVATGSETRTYKIDVAVDAAIPNTSQSGTAALGFTWEAQNS